MSPSWRHPYERIGVSVRPLPERLDTGDVTPGEKKQWIAPAQPEQSTAAASIAQKMPMYF